MSEGEYYGFEHSTMQYVHSSTGNDDPSDLPAYTSPIVIENVIFATPEEISSVGYEAFPDTRASLRPLRRRPLPLPGM